MTEMSKMQEPEIMEQMLIRTAERLDGLPEECLDALWQKYARQTISFEPTREWEQAVLVFCLINAKRMKNQLFNYYWKTKDGQVEKQDEESGGRSGLFQPAASGARRKTPCPLLRFPAPDRGEGR